MKNICPHCKYVIGAAFGCFGCLEAKAERASLTQKKAKNAISKVGWYPDFDDYVIDKDWEPFQTLERLIELGLENGPNKAAFNDGTRIVILWDNGEIQEFKNRKKFRKIFDKAINRILRERTKS